MNATALRACINEDFDMCSLSNSAVFKLTAVIPSLIELVLATDVSTDSSIYLSIFCAIEFRGKCATAKICLQVFLRFYLF